MESLLILLLIGAIAGWLAGLIVKGYGFGLFGNIAVGILGSIIGSWLFGHSGMHLGSALANSIFGATLGAVILLLFLRLMRI